METLQALILARLGAGASRHVRSLRRDERGTVAVLFAITFSGAMLMAAIAIDFARTQVEVVRVQNAVDTAALAASHHLGLPDQDTAGPQTATAFFQANLAKHPSVGVLDSVKLDAVNGEVAAKAKGDVLSSLLRAFGINEIGFKANSTVRRGKGTIELALALDNSGSMAGTYIADLRTAAQNLVKVVYTGFEGTDKINVSVVPFAAAVNVGPTNIAAAWMDTKGLSPTHFENFDQSTTRFELLKQMSVAWGGCVEVRPTPHDVTDSTPSEGTPASLFVPMFNPDEPDDANSGGYSYGNSYLPDYGGSCPAPPPTCLKTNWKGSCSQWSQPPELDPAVAQARVCKYKDATIGAVQGPNYLCDSAPILPLTKDKSAVISLIQGMQAKGGTNILEGLMWGWRVLSPEPPFTEGRPYDDPDNDKFLILMTDGENWHQARSNHNNSSYHSFGFASNKRLGETYTTSALVAQMNAKTLAACQNAKAAGVKVYTVAFRLDAGSAARQMLATCATNANQAYVASDGQALIQAFESIGREIARLRVAG
jgi:Flp pilus assembly protein TadG